MEVECYASDAAMDTRIDRMPSVSWRPAALDNCQRNRLDTLTLCLTSIDSFNTAAGAHLYTQDTHTHLLSV